MIVTGVTVGGGGGANQCPIEHVTVVDDLLIVRIARVYYARAIDSLDAATGDPSLTGSSSSHRHHDESQWKILPVPPYVEKPWRGYDQVPSYTTVFQG